MIETLFEENKALSAKLKENSIQLYNLVREELMALVKAKGGCIDFVDRMGVDIDECDSEWMDMYTMCSCGSQRLGYPYKVTIENPYGKEDLVFYGYSEDGEDVYSNCDTIDGMTLYFLLEFFKEYSK